MSTTFNQLDDCVQLTIFWADDKTSKKRQRINGLATTSYYYLSKKVHLCPLLGLIYWNRMRAA